MKKTTFGYAKSGEEVFLYTLENQNGVKAQITNYGAILVSLMIPDKQGNYVDVVLGYDNAEGYHENGSFFGSTVGPLANRTKNASFTIGDKVIQLDKNDNGNNLHSHAEYGFHKRIWEVRGCEKGISFLLDVKDGELGFSGNRNIAVTYTLTDTNELKIHYEGESDQKTVFNMTNHSYFNLAGHGSGTIEHHKVQMHADTFTVVDKEMIATGEVCSVTDTPMDFTQSKEIGKEVNAPFEQLELAGGYDHNWLINEYNQEMKSCFLAQEPVSGRSMEVLTDLPGFQFYIGNFIKEQTGKEGKTYRLRQGFCVETQYPPNAANLTNFPSIVFGEGKKYETTTIFRFSW